ncbi:MAG: saccharopine dehydrogenase C-terminal domain-containing protein [Bacteroidota bacterium]
MKKIAVLGLGKVGSLVALLLHEKYDVTGVDQQKPHYDLALPFDTIKMDLSDENNLRELLANKDAVVSALPYFLNRPISDLAVELGVHYFDLTEDVPTTNHIRSIAQHANTVLLPQCGLAPGFIGIVGADIANRFDRLRDMELRVGALPRYPNGLLAYSFTWSPAGVINEYLNDAEVIRNGERMMVPSLDGIEYINIEGQEFEAFSTSGGLGTMCETYEGKLDTLNYKSIRYPGHGKLMRFLMYELILKKDKKELEEILSNAKPPVKEDVVYVYAVVEGWKSDRLVRDEYYKAFYPKTIGGYTWRAISWTTAASIAAMVEMVDEGTLPQKGFVRQEDVDYQAFLKTTNGSLYNE